jgi:hypothetical protein
MTNDNQLIDLTRRKLLIGAGAIGLASAGAGLGTSALRRALSRPIPLPSERPRSRAG